MSSPIPPPAAKGRTNRLYRLPLKAGTEQYRYVSKEVAALSFLSSIPLAREDEIIATNIANNDLNNATQARMKVTLEEQRKNSVRDEETLQGDHTTKPTDQPKDEPSSSNTSTRWWEKLFFTEYAKRAQTEEIETADLEAPDQVSPEPAKSPTSTSSPLSPAASYTPQKAVPGRRLHGLSSSYVRLPPSLRSTDSHHAQSKLQMSRDKARVARQTRWEVRLAHGVSDGEEKKGGESKALIDSRVFFSSLQAYPAMVYSIIKYEPHKEASLRRRRKIEEMGGGGRMYFQTEGRDWRGTSYRSIVFDMATEVRVAKRQVEMERRMKERKKRKREKKREKRRLKINVPESSSSESSQSSGSDTDYSSGEDMLHYRPGFLDDPEMVHGRHCQRIIGDKQIGPFVASTILFVKPKALKDELNKQFRERFDGWEPERKKWKYIRAKAVNGVYTLVDGDGEEEDDIHLPSSLTLSKVRSLKKQVLLGCLSADCEVSTVALACVYFERLCLDCRVDKRNRRLSMAACLLLAYKFNEPNVQLVNEIREDEGEGKKKKRKGVMSTFRVHRKNETTFASVMEFLSTEWGLAPKELFQAEFGVFVALGFRLHATPSQVAFHFKRLMDSVEKLPLPYLGRQMYDAWQSSLDTDHRQRERRQKRRREKQEEQDKKLVELQFAARREAHNNIYSEDTVGEDSGDPSSTQLDETSGADELGFVSRNPSKDGKGKTLLQKLLMRSRPLGENLKATGKGGEEDQELASRSLGENFKATGKGGEEEIDLEKGETPPPLPSDTDEFIQKERSSRKDIGGGTLDKIV